jgi:hypothetical protein
MIARRIIATRPQIILPWWRAGGVELSAVVKVLQPKGAASAAAAVLSLKDGTGTSYWSTAQIPWSAAVGLTSRASYGISWAPINFFLDYKVIIARVSNIPVGSHLIGITGTTGGNGNITLSFGDETYTFTVRTNSVTGPTFSEGIVAVRYKASNSTFELWLNGELINVVTSVGFVRLGSFGPGLFRLVSYNPNNTSYYVGGRAAAFASYIDLTDAQIVAISSAMAGI